MEVVDIVSYYIFEEKKQIEVSFKLNTDSDDEVRTDLIDIDEFSNYGYNVIDENISQFFLNDDDDDEFEEDFDDFIDIDEDILVQFLNEYYIINPKKLPKTELM